jgi:hypothetical protein
MPIEYHGILNKWQQTLQKWWQALWHFVFQQAHQILCLVMHCATTLKKTSQVLMEWVSPSQFCWVSLKIEALNLHNASWIECNLIEFELKWNFINLKWIEPNTILCSFGFNNVNVPIEISIELNLVELNHIESNSIQIGWIQPNYEKGHVNFPFHI